MLCTSATIWRVIPTPDDDDGDDDDGNWCGAVSGMRTGGGNRSTQRKPAPVPLCPLQIPHDLTWDQTWATTMGSQQLSA
jgi:hypothetical protein